MSGPVFESAEDVLHHIRVHEALENRKLLIYQPYPKQIEFHEQGATKRERLLCAGNQQGKTLAGGMEAAMHATGLYPPDWKGRRFERATRGWVAGISNEQTRDNAQRMLYGPVEKPKTGAIPAELIQDVGWARGMGHLIDTLLVRHTSGEISYISFKSYEQGRLKFQGETIDWIWLDEEPPEDVYTECLARLIANPKAMLFITFTPLMGSTALVRHFYPHPDTDERGMVRMEIQDAKHISEERREQIIAAFPPHEREARANGIPMLGSGQVFPISESFIICDPMEIPSYWQRIVGLDFGWNHPTAAVWLAVNPNSGTVYITDEYKQKEETPVVHAAAIRLRGHWIPVAWPHDGYQHDKATGISMAVQYREQGLRMIPEHAQFPDGQWGIEGGIMKMLDAMKIGKLKVFSTCTEWLDEFRMYHRAKGKIVKEEDDLMAATRYAFMSLRYAREEEMDDRFPAVVGMDYNPFSDGRVS